MEVALAPVRLGLLRQGVQRQAAVAIDEAPARHRPGHYVRWGAPRHSLERGTPRSMERAGVRVRE